MSWFQENQHYLVALTLAGVLVLLYKAMKDANLKLAVPVTSAAAANQEGFGFAPGSRAGHWGEFSQPGQTGMFVKNDRDHPSGAEGMWPHEPPVFWNAGDYAAVGSAQAAGIADEVLVDPGSVWDPVTRKYEQVASTLGTAVSMGPTGRGSQLAIEGLYGGRRRASYVDGMSNRFDDANLMNKAY